MENNGSLPLRTFLLIGMQKPLSEHHIISISLIKFDDHHIFGFISDEKNNLQPC